MALLAEQHFIQQEDRIERQKELIAALKNDGREAMAKDAQRLLSEMLVLLARMRGDLKQAQKRLQDIDADAARD